MRLKNRLNEALRFLSFAFYPKTTLIACVIFSASVVTILGVAMALVPEGAGFYNIVFALTTCFIFLIFTFIILR